MNFDGSGQVQHGFRKPGQESEEGCENVTGRKLQPQTHSAPEEATWSHEYVESGNGTAQFLTSLTKRPVWFPLSGE